MNDYDANPLERAMKASPSGRVMTRDLIDILMAAELTLPNVTRTKHSFQPLFFKRNGCAMIVAFSDESYAAQYANVAPYCVVMKARELFSCLPLDFGVLVNPEHKVGLDISPNDVMEILKAYKVNDRHFSSVIAFTGSHQLLFG